MTKILVTGATGNVGSEVIKALQDLGQPMVAAAMDEQDAQRVPGEGTETVYFGFALQFILVMVGLYTATRFGAGKRVAPDVEQLLGRKPIAMQHYIQDYAEAWVPSAASGDSDQQETE